ncbi:hypothetical protein PRIPAC_84919 [Pristionchus pacificus]|uniref:Uncharacterized protein n=1 Tax=Pristionchus pacificus TaxID=54126 RepID=A0A2A6BUB3_PRIPA|nr:hypothetical protein PRIPAC_84919 [Pristionchus pacificus]|eukprot:PDM69504.1 hypothetical protein PRIPAC_44600 [Pristionchus pacificus]
MMSTSESNFPLRDELFALTDRYTYEVVLNEQCSRRYLLIVVHRWLNEPWNEVKTIPAAAIEAHGLVIPIARRMLEGHALYRIELMPEFFRAAEHRKIIDTAILLHGEAMLHENILRENLTVITNYLNSTEEEKKRFEHAEDIEFIVKYNRKRLEQEYTPSADGGEVCYGMDGSAPAGSWKSKSCGKQDHDCWASRVKAKIISFFISTKSGSVAVGSRKITRCDGKDEL